MEAQSLGRHGEHIVLLHRKDRDVSRESGFQFQVGIGGRDHHLVGDDVTLGLCLLAHLCHGTVKLILREGIYGKAHALSFLHTANVSLVDIGNHAHIRQILSNDEEFRGVERSSHRLTFLHGLREDHTVDGRGNRGIAEVRLGFLHTLTRRVHLFLGLQIRKLGTLKLIGTHKSFLIEGLIPIIISLLIGSRALGTRQIGLRSIQLTDEVRTIEFSDDLTLLYHRVVIHIKMADDTRDLRTNGHTRHRLNRTCGSDAGMDARVLHLGGLKRNLLFLFPASQEEPRNQDHGNNADGDPTFLSDLFHILYFFTFHSSLFTLFLLLDRMPASAGYTA